MTGDYDLLIEEAVDDENFAEERGSPASNCFTRPIRLSVGMRVSSRLWVHLGVTAAKYNDGHPS